MQSQHHDFLVSHIEDPNNSCSDNLKLSGRINDKSDLEDEEQDHDDDVSNIEIQEVQIQSDDSLTNSDENEEDTTEQIIDDEQVDEDEDEDEDEEEKQQEKTQQISQLEVDQDQSGSNVSSQHSRFAQAPIPVLKEMVIDNI